MRVVAPVRKLLQKLSRDAVRAGVPTSADTLKPDVLRCRVAYNAHGGYCIPDASSHRPAAEAV